jgi:pimeloyl-ACP methyl ester carboxylesterase
MSRWVLLRGLAREARHWGDFPTLLMAGIADAQVIAPDLPGNGQLFRKQSPAHIEAMVEHLRNELRQQQAAPPYHLLALSLGGMVAVAWAERYPEEIAGLVLINTSLRPLNPWYRRLRPGSYATLLRIALASANAALRERLIIDLTSNAPRETAAVLPQWIAWRNECLVSTGNALRQIAAAMDYRAPSTAPRVPTLMLASSGDRLVDARCTRQLSQRWGAPMALHATAGHDLPLDDGPWVVAQVREWLQGA